MRGRLGEVLLESGAITRPQLETALRRQARHGGRLGTCLMELGSLDERKLCTALAQQHGVPAAGSEQVERADPRAVAKLGADTAIKLRAVPLRDDGRALSVAVEDPGCQAQLARATGRAVRVFVTPEQAIEAGLARHYGAPVRPRPPVAQAAAPAAKTESWAGASAEINDEAIDAVTGYIDDAPAPRRVARPAAATERLTLDEATSRLLSTVDEAEVCDVALAYVAQDAARAAVVLVADGGELCSGTARGVDAMAWRGAGAQPGTAPLIDQTLATGRVYAGPFMPEDLGPLARPLGIDSPVGGVIVPITCGTDRIGVALGIDVALDALRTLEPDLERLSVKLDAATAIVRYRRVLVG